MVIKTTTFYRKECHLFSYASHVLHSLLIVLVKGQGNQENQYGTNTLAILMQWHQERLYLCSTAGNTELLIWYKEMVPGSTRLPWYFLHCLSSNLWPEDPEMPPFDRPENVNWTKYLHKSIWFSIVLQAYEFLLCFILQTQICAKVNKFSLACKWIKLDGIALIIQSLLKVLPNKGIFHRTWNSFSNEIHNTQCKKCQRYNFATIWKHLKHIHIVGKPFMVRHLDNCFNMPMHFLSVCIGTESFNQWKFTQVSWWQNQFLYERLKKLWVKLCFIVLLCYCQWKFLLLLQFWGFEQNPKHFEIVEFRF